MDLTSIYFILVFRQILINYRLKHSRHTPIIWSSHSVERGRNGHIYPRLVNLQINGLFGIEAGITGSITGFYATEPNPDLDVFKGTEMGLQADVRAFGPASIAGAFNKGVEFQWPFDSHGNWRGFTKTTYEAITLGVSVGVVPLPVSFSGYLGVSDYLYRSDK